MTVHAYYEVKELTNSCNMLALRHICVLYLLMTKDTPYKVFSF